MTSLKNIICGVTVAFGIAAAPAVFADAGSLRGQQQLQQHKVSKVKQTIAKVAQVKQVQSKKIIVKAIQQKQVQQAKQMLQQQK